MLWRVNSAQRYRGEQAFPNLKLFFILLLLVFLLGGWSPWSQPSDSQPASGVLVYGAPLQEEITLEPWEDKNYTFAPLASYEITARILSKKVYTSDRAAEISPVDLALGWEAMSDTTVLQSLDIKQSGRWYYVSWRNAPVNADTIIQHSANTHILPATPDVAEAVQALQKNQVVRLRGSLVLVTAKDGFLWRSSVTRSDTGNGSCEVFWVTDVDVQPRETLQASASQNLIHQHN
jgi:hypothetical protein